MRAAVWHAAGDVRVDDVAEPAARDGEVLVEVDLACICASDIAEYRDGPHVIPVSRPHPLTGRAAPVTLGHEYVGRVVEVGGGVEGLAVGDRVCGDACLRCETCYWCVRGEYNICARGASVGLHADGAFAPRLTVPAYTLAAVPDAVPDTTAALVEPLAVGLHALRRARFQAGETVVVIGFGMVGASVLLSARASGAAAVVVVEGSPARSETARQLGAAEVCAPEDDVRGAARARTQGIGADVVVDCTGSAAVLPVAVELARRGGRVVICGIPHQPSQVSAARLVYFEREVIGALGYRHDHGAVLAMLADGRLSCDGILGPVIDLEDIVTEGFERITRDPSAPLRVPVDPARSR